MPVMMERIKIEGIKLSNELAAVNFRNLPNVRDHQSRFCHILAGNQVNLIFLSTTCIGENNQLLCCVAVEDQRRVKDLIDSEPGMNSYVEYIHDVGLLSVFPHQFSLKTLGLVLKVFGKTHLPLYGLASSLSALTFITDYVHLSKAVTALQECLDVPPDQISLKPEIRVRQSRNMKKY